MSTQSHFENIKISNIPIVNLRQEFEGVYKYFHSDDFKQQLSNKQRSDIYTPILTWHYSEDEFFTLFVQRAILGIESYLPYATQQEAYERGLLTVPLVKTIQHPFSLGGRKAYDNLYHRLPSLINDNISLKNSELELWEANVLFYKKVRNPLFHGKNLSQNSLPEILKIYKHMKQLYNWIDSWHKFAPFKHFNNNKTSNKNINQTGGNPA